MTARGDGAATRGDGAAARRGGDGATGAFATGCPVCGKATDLLTAVTGLPCHTCTVKAHRKAVGA